MLEQLQLTLNAQFYRPRSVELTAVDVQALVAAASANFDSERHQLLADVLRSPRNTASGIQYHASLRVFPTQRPVYFWSQDGDPSPEDIIHAYILILEFPHHFAIFKKSCADLSRPLARCAVQVSYDDLIGTIDERAAAYQKLSARQMTVAETAIRGRAYEAADLKGTLSTFMAGRSVVRSLRLRDRGTVRTIHLGTSRLVDAADRQNIDQAAEWAAHRLRSPQNRRHDFISRFARSVALPEVLDRATPVALLIDGAALVERLRAEGLQLMYTTTRKRLVFTPSSTLNLLLRLFEKVYTVVPNDPDYRLEGTKGRLRITSVLTFQAPLLARFKVLEQNKSITLQRYLITRQLYTITFSLPEYVYTGGSCFQDHSAVADIPAVLDLLKPIPDLEQASSEKGQLTPATRDFDDQSVFGVVEHQHRQEAILICDDLGVEWADHMALDLEAMCVTFIHSKHGDETSSASKLHDVVGQALKNLGNMMFTAEQFQAKYEQSWRNDYAGTRIPKIRIGDRRQLRAKVNQLLADPRLHRKCVLACSFLSKRRVVRELNRLHRGEPVRGHIVQLFWILSSFAHTVKEAGVVPVIYCRP